MWLGLSSYAISMSSSCVVEPLAAICTASFASSCDIGHLLYDSSFNSSLAFPTRDLDGVLSPSCTTIHDLASVLSSSSTTSLSFDGVISSLISGTCM